MAYSKSPRPYRRYSVLLDYGAATHLYTVRALDKHHARHLAAGQHRRRWSIPKDGRIGRIIEVFEGTVRRATS